MLVLKNNLFQVMLGKKKVNMYTHEEVDKFLNNQELINQDSIKRFY